MKRRKGKIVHIVAVFIFLFSQSSSLHNKAEERASKNWTLSFENPTERHPAQLLLNITQSDDSYNISIRPSRYGGQHDREYKISAVLLYMNVSNGGTHGGNEFPLQLGPGSFPIHTNPPTISISKTGHTTDHSTYYNYTEDSFNLIEVSNDTFVMVTSKGVWKDGDWAQVILTVYYDETNCYLCSSDAFCCEPAQGCPDSNSKKIDLSVSDSDDGRTRVIQFKETIHELSMKMHQSRFASQKRCIPDSLTCNGVLNCGHFCNHDEADEVCYPPTEFMCPSYECYWDMSFVWTALLAIVFFVISPTVVVFLICYHRQLTVMTRRRRHGGSDSSIVVHSPPNDVPPSYDELVHGMEEPPPCFCRATSMIDGSTGGIDNPTFYPEDSTTMTVQKSGSISIPVIECSCNSNNSTAVSTTVITPLPAPVSPVSPVHNGDADNDDKTESPRNPRDILTTTPVKSQRQLDDSNLESQTNNNNNLSSNIDSHV